MPTSVVKRFLSLLLAAIPALQYVLVPLTWAASAISTQTIRPKATRQDGDEQFEHDVAAVVGVSSLTPQIAPASYVHSPELYEIWKPTLPPAIVSSEAAFYLPQEIDAGLLERLIGARNPYWCALRDDPQAVEEILKRLHLFSRPFARWLLQEFEADATLRDAITNQAPIVWIGLKGSLLWGQANTPPEDIDVTIVLESPMARKRSYTIPAHWLPAAFLDRLTQVRPHEQTRQTKVQLMILTRGYVEGRDLMSSEEKRRRRLLRRRSQTIASIWTTAVPLYSRFSTDLFGDASPPLSALLALARDLVEDANRRQRVATAVPSRRGYELHKAHKRLLEAEVLLLWLSLGLPQTKGGLLSSEEAEKIQHRIRAHVCGQDQIPTPEHSVQRIRHIERTLRALHRVQAAPDALPTGSTQPSALTPLPGSGGTAPLGQAVRSADAATDSI